MKAAIRKNYCSPSQIKIEEVETPTPQDQEVLIKVYATTVNRTDCANLTAKPFIMRFILGLINPKKIILGTDFAGEVVSIGKNVKSFKIGDGVFGFIDIGAESQAEYICKKEDGVFLIPENIDFKIAAASLEGAHYAYSFLHKSNIKSGQSILINGATGAIGSALMQFVKQYEVRITATCDQKNIELTKSLGADKIIDYTKEDFTNDDNKYDYVFDTVGKSTFGKCKSILKEKGVYISSELGPFNQNIFYPLITLFLKKKVVFPIPNKTSLTIPFITDQLKKNKFSPVIDKEYLHDDISKAYDYVIQGFKTGNVIINIYQDD